MTNPYLDLLQSQPNAATGAPPAEGNPYLGMLQEADDLRRQQMAGQLTQAVKVNPEQYSTQRRVAQYLGYPTAAVEALPALADQAKVQQIQQDAQRAPVLQRKYTDADFAKLAHDDSSTLSQIEGAAASIAKFIVSAPGAPGGGLLSSMKRGLIDNSVIGIAGAGRLLAEGAANFTEMTVPGMAQLEASGQYGGNPLRRLAEGFGMIGAQQQAIKDANTPKTEGNLAAGLASGGESAGQNLKYAPLAFFGPPGWAAALAGMVTETAGTTYQQDREKGIDAGRATLHATADGLAEYVGERYFGEVGFLQRLAAGAPASKLMMWELTREVPGEIGTTLWQNFNEWAITNPGKPVAEFLREQPDAIVQTAIATLVGGAVQTGTGRSAVHVIEATINRQMEITESLQREEALKQLMALAGQSKLADRSPEQLKAFVDEASGDATARFDAATLVEAFNQDVQALSQALPSVNLQELQDAAASGGEVSVPLGELVTGTRGTGLENTILEHARLGDNPLSAAEAREVQGKVAEELQQRVEQVVAQAQDAEAARLSHDRVRQMLVDQLNAAGRYRPSVNEGMASWAAAFYTTMGARMGLSAEDFYQRYPLRVLGEQPGVQGSVLNGLAQPAAVNIADGYQSLQIGDTAVEITAKDGHASISMVKTPEDKRGQGSAREALSQVVRAADAQGLTLTLTPEPMDRKTSKAKLEKFYKSLGFKPNKGRSKDFRYSDAMIREPQQALNQPAYHGTPHRGIDKFSTDKIGTGEGAQAYGWGLYFASKREIAEWYRENLSKQSSQPPRWFFRGEELLPESPAYHAASLLDGRTLAQVRKEVRGWVANAKPGENIEHYRDVLRVLESAEKKSDFKKKAAQGQLYAVEIPEDSQMLLWDKPLSEQPAAVRDALEGIADKHNGGEVDTRESEAISTLVEDAYDDPTRTGRDMYEGLAGALGERIRNTYNTEPSPRAASEALAAAGIKGIKYLDGTSRGAGEGSYNYVVFSGDDVAITEQFYQRADRGPRGTFNPRTLEIVLNPHSDLSSFFHETGHFFLEVLADVGTQPDSPLAEDWGKVLNWFGVTAEQWAAMTLDEKRPYHERWAESVEQYVMEGKAPSRELQPLMRKFAAWLKSVYQSIQKFLAQRGARYSGPGLGQEVKPPARLYRGEASEQDRAKRAGGAAWSVLGKGLYTTRDKRFAAKFGKVVEVPTSEAWPTRPLVIENAAGGADAAVWNWIREQGLFTGRRAAFEAQHPDIGEFIQSLGYDGIVVGDEVVRYNTVAKSGQALASDSPQEQAGEGGALPQQAEGQPQEFNAPLNDDIRRVMDRLLATDEQIAEANEIAGLVPELDADAEAAERLNKRSMADLKWAVKARDKVIAKLKREARGIEKGIREEVTAEVNQMPEVLAKDMLAKTQRENGGQLNDTERAIIADAFGYESVDAMLKAIDAFGSKADAIDGLTERRMLEEHGDLIDDRAIKEAANEAVHNEARARSLATELRTQREMLGARADTGEVNAKGSKITVNVLMEAAKQFGANVVDRTPLRDLKAAVWRHTQAERRAAKRWAEATAAGKTAEAVQAKQDQMLQNAAAKAAVDAKAEAAKIFDFFKRVAKGNDEKVVEKGRDPDIVNAARAVLAAYGVQTPASKGAEAYLETLEKNDPETYNVIAPMVAAATQNAQPLEALTFSELQALHEEVAAMWFLAKRSRQMEVNGDLMDIADAADEIHARLEEIGIPDTIPGERGALTKGEERARMLQFGAALLRRVEQWAERIDGKFGGPFLRLVFQPVKDAATRYKADHIAYRAKFQALADNVAPAMTHQLIDAPELGYTFGRGHNGIGHAELLHAILHTGNESNKRKLLLGRGWATENADGTLDTSRWDAFLKRLADTGVLQSVHYDFAQGVWDLLESTKPLAQQTHRAVFGRYFAEVTAEPFVDPFGVQRRGGYVPAQADPAIVADASLRALAERENENMAYSFPTTSKGFTKTRTEYNRPLKLDLRTLPQHLDKVLLFSHMEPAVRGVSKLLRQKGVATPLSRIEPAAYDGMLLPWLNRSARQQVETPIVGDGRMAKILSTLRARSGAALMFANVSNTVQQVTGLSSAAVKVSPAHLMRASVQYLQQRKKMAEAVANASEYMRTRMDGSVADMDDTIKQILTNPSAYEKAQDWSRRHAYFLQQAFDNVLSPIVWTGAHNDALAQKMDERMAVRFADGVVRQTQGALAAEDVSRIETGPAYARMFTQFASYWNMLANTNATALQQISQEVGIRKGAGRALYVVTMGFLLPVWIAEAIAVGFKGGPGDGDGDGDADTLVDWLAAVLGMGTIKGLLAQVPFIGQLANASINRFNSNPADDRMSISPAVGMLEAAAGTPSDLYKIAKGEGNWRNTVRDVSSLITLATGLPVSAAARPLGYAAGVAQDKIEPTGPVDAVRGAITGVPSEASKVK